MNILCMIFITFYKYTLYTKLITAFEFGSVGETLRPERIRPSSLPKKKITNKRTKT